MCCGFGAVILLVMLINGQTLQKREETQKDLRAELERVSQLKEFADSHLKGMLNEVEATELEEAELLVQADQVRAMIIEDQQQNKLAEEEAKQIEKEIEAIEKQISSLKKSKQKLKNSGAAKPLDDKPVGFDGDGQRQYLTGLKLGGDRTLILVDASASMLDETIVNIIRRKLMDDSVRRQSPKWLRVVSTVHWLVANLQPGKKFQVYYFNTKPFPAVQDNGNQWLSTNNPKHRDEAIKTVRGVAPIGGTNLSAAFDVISRLVPKPDSVLLLTDGLPTQGRSGKTANTITGEERLLLFYNAVSSLPAGVPVNTLLFPMEGDPSAASVYWKLAIDTRGSFITPSRDWP